MECIYQVEQGSLFSQSFWFHNVFQVWYVARVISSEDITNRKIEASKIVNLGEYSFSSLDWSESSN